MRRASRPAFWARRTSERVATECTGRIPPALTIRRQLYRRPSEQNTTRGDAHEAARISRNSPVIIPRSYSERDGGFVGTVQDMVSRVEEGVLVKESSAA